MSEKTKKAQRTRRSNEKKIKEMETKLETCRGELRTYKRLIKDNWRPKD